MSDQSEKCNSTSEVSKDFQMYTGYVKWFGPNKTYGYLTEPSFSESYVNGIICQIYNTLEKKYLLKEFSEEVVNSMKVVAGVQKLDVPEDIFVHRTAITTQIDPDASEVTTCRFLVKGEKVCFDVKSTNNEDKPFEAVNVSGVSKSKNVIANDQNARYYFNYINNSRSRKKRHQDKDRMYNRTKIPGTKSDEKLDDLDQNEGEAWRTVEKKTKKNNSRRRRTSNNDETL